MHNLHKKFFVAAIMGGLLLPTLCAAAPAEPAPPAVEAPAPAPSRFVYHPYPDEEQAAAPDGSISIRLVNKKQFYDDYGEFLDTAVNSPKSVNIHPDGSKYYVNALEAGLTIVYDAMKAKANNFASSYASIESSAKADLDKLVEDILAVGE